jgi:hypothetical protein
MKHLLFALLIFTCACKDKKNGGNNIPGHGGETPVGGPCAYKENFYTATILSLKKIDDRGFDLQIKLTPESGTSLSLPDTIWYSMFERNGYLSDQQIKTDSIYKGKNCRYYVNTIVSGSCNPRISGFLFR